jgi:carboxypeptidase family protein
VNKLLTMAAFGLLCSAVAAAAQTVEVMDLRPSTQNPSIAVTTDGKLQANAKLVVFDADGRSVLSLMTNAHGVATLPDLGPGKYCIVASTSPTHGGAVCLLISGGQARKPSAFSVALREQPPPPPTLEEKLSALEKAPIDTVTRAFSGTVVDPLGAVIFKATVSIFRHGSAFTLHPQKAITDESGRFSMALDPGKYTAMIQSPGFETRFLTIEISSDAKEEPIKVTLNVGRVSESVSVAANNRDH